MNVEKLKDIVNVGGDAFDTLGSVVNVAGKGADVRSKWMTATDAHEKTIQEINKIISEVQSSKEKNEFKIDHYKRLSDKLDVEHEAYQELLVSDPTLLLNPDLQKAFDKYWDRVSKINSDINDL